MTSSAGIVVGELAAAADLAAHPNRHYAGTRGVLGVRMGTVFEIAKRNSGMPLAEVGRLLDEDPYESRMAAFCILDFQVRDVRLPSREREARYRLYLDRHDAIDAWDMVDRSAPRVVGMFLRERSREPLFDLAVSADPLRRRTAMTAPLAYTRPLHRAGIADLLRIAEMLATDPDPVVSRPVGIALRHAGAVAPDAVRELLARMGTGLPEAIRREVMKTLPASAE
ncbi:DNA alkylation repair protein [Microterricola pindariensis]|uniref:DNA alkylation repair protein n=1 Tax=Microterricola pindariensis TaxID=478010 RepID=A0ABX5ATI9_9MICO|nr:DNA alkylation repair protein [Microterricola pindariensis]PPL16939.1 hypothetical protein GY24_12010 [Microterricola pindariensis]